MDADYDNSIDYCDAWIYKFYRRTVADRNLCRRYRRHPDCADGSEGQKAREKKTGVYYSDESACRNNIDAGFCGRSGGLFYWRVSFALDKIICFNQTFPDN